MLSFGFMKQIKAMKHMGYLDSQILLFAVIHFYIQAVPNVNVTFLKQSQLNQLFYIS